MLKKIRTRKHGNSCEGPVGLSPDSLCNLHTPWSRVLLEKLTSFQVVKKFMEPKGSFLHSKCLSPVPILSQLNPVHTPTSHLLKVCLNIILMSMPRCLSLRFYHQNPVYTSLPHVCYISCPSHSS